MDSKDWNQSCLKSLRTNNFTMKSVVLLLLPACLLPALAKAQNLAKYGIIDQQAPLGTYGFNNGNNGFASGSNGNGFVGGSNNGNNNGLGGGLNGNNNNNNGNGFVGGLNGNVGIGGVSGPSVEEVNLKMLRGSVPGTPGVDYPIFSQAPITNFDCSDKIFGGYYADVDAQCQSFHICGRDGGQGWSFICPNGTIFNQAYLICDWWFNFDCTQAQAFYNVNLQLGIIPFGATTTTTTFINDNGIVNTNNNNNNNNNNGFGGNNINNNNNNGFGNNNNNGFASNTINSRPINSYGSPIRTTVSTFTNNAQPTIINRNLPNSNSFNNNGFLSSNNPSLTTYTNNNGRPNQGNNNNNNNNGITIVDDVGDYVYSTDDVIYDELTDFNGNNLNGGGSGVPTTTTTIIEPVAQNYGVPLGNPIGGNSLRRGRTQRRRNRNRS